MNRTMTLLFSMIILGATFSGCISDSNDTLDDEPDNSAELELQAKLNDLENQTLIYQIQINELLISLNNSNENVSTLSKLLDNSSNDQENLTLRLQENLTIIQELNNQIEQYVLQITELELRVSELEDQLPDSTEEITAPKLLVITVDVEAGNKCGVGIEIQTCMYGVFGNQSAGISEMMDIADEVGVKISFFVDVMEVYAYGDELIQVMQDIDSRGHDVQLHFHPSMINSTNWDIIQNSESWNESGATRDTYMTCWDQNTADFWFSKAMEIFDEANITRPIAYRSGAYRYCDTIIQAMGNHNMTQSYNYNMFSSGRQNFTAGYLHNFQWENEVYEFPITYVKDTNGELIINSRIDESTWSISVNDTFERYFENQSSTRVMTMILHSFSFLDRNESGDYYLKDQSKVNNFRTFILNLSNEYTIVSSSELQTYIDDGTIEGEFKLPLRFLENECHRNDAPHIL
jgi:hypothetical protein